VLALLARVSHSAQIVPQYTIGAARYSRAHVDRDRAAGGGTDGCSHSSAPHRGRVRAARCCSGVDHESAVRPQYSGAQTPQLSTATSEPVALAFRLPPLARHPVRLLAVVSISTRSSQVRRAGTTNAIVAQHEFAQHVCAQQRCCSNDPTRSRRRHCTARNGTVACACVGATQAQQQPISVCNS
jgi:hypothetical protein